MRRSSTVGKNFTIENCFHNDFFSVPFGITRIFVKRPELNLIQEMQKWLEHVYL